MSVRVTLFIDREPVSQTVTSKRRWDTINCFCQARPCVELYEFIRNGRRCMLTGCSVYDMECTPCEKNEKPAFDSTVMDGFCQEIDRLVRLSWQK